MNPLWCGRGWDFTQRINDTSESPRPKCKAFATNRHEFGKAIWDALKRNAKRINVSTQIQVIDNFDPLQNVGKLLN